MHASVVCSLAQHHSFADVTATFQNAIDSELLSSFFCKKVLEHFQVLSFAVTPSLADKNQILDYDEVLAIKPPVEGTNSHDSGKKPVEGSLKDENRTSDGDESKVS